MASNFKTDWHELILKNDDDKKDFCQWFWTDTNGNDLIQALNNESDHRKKYPTEFVSRGNRPYVYAIVLNYPFDLKDDKKRWKFCKIGLTQVDTTKGTGNRMEKVMNDIHEAYHPCKGIAQTFFKQPINPTDHRNIRDVEKSIRDAFGHKVPKEKANDLHFPVPTEWVITTQAFINKVKDKVNDTCKSRGHATTEVFSKKFKFESDKHPLPDALNTLCFPSQEELKKCADRMSKETTSAGGAMGLDDSMSELGLEDSTMSPKTLKGRPRQGTSKMTLQK